MSGTPGVRRTQIGSWSGVDHELALRIGFEETPDLPVLSELPDRGPHSAMIGRATALLPGLSVDLQPAGWRLVHGEARDRRVTEQLFRDDLERLDERCEALAQSQIVWSRSVKIAVAGPWTLAASLDLPLGERALADSGARRELAESLATGIGDLRSELARRLHGVEAIIQLDEPMLPMVAGGEVRTSSRLNRIAAIDEPELVAPLEMIAASGPTWLHSCAADVPVRSLLRIPGLTVSVDAALLSRQGWDAVGEALDSGSAIALGHGEVTGPDDLAHRVLDRIEQLGLGPEIRDRLWLTPSCGLADRTEAEAVRILRALRSAADIVTDTLVGQ